EPDQRPWQEWRPEGSHLAARRFQRELRELWRVTSYSALLQQNSHPLQELLPHLDTEAAGDSDPQENEQQSLTVHTFPKGAAAGTFLHGLLESIDFTESVEVENLHQPLLQHGFDPVWLPVLQQWLQTILTVPLYPESLSLSCLPSSERQVEMQFYLPVNTLLQAQQLDSLARQYDPLSQHKPPLNFHQVTGMLKGFIDLVFRWQGRYYLLDYKSNWLGSDEQAYSQSALERAMCEHHYDLQYQIYTLALHRLLRQRLPDYDYQRHFGGVFYLFLRGMTAEKQGQGIFYCRPSWQLVQGMDQLFSGEESLC
ncbi:MAG: PD-(D/E)XK nuclease family protein, partial [Enterobacteriaceae bacterium]